MSELELTQKSLPSSDELYNRGKLDLSNITELKVGSGSSIFFTDKEGSRWGHATFDSAPAWIKIDGTFNFKNSDGDTVLDESGITATSIADGLITAAKTNIAAINPVDGEINYNKIGTLQLDDNAVTEAKIAASAVSASKTNIAAINPIDGEINASKIGTTQLDDDAVTEAKILASAVTEAKIASNAVTEGKISALSVTAVKIAAGAITSEKILAGAVTANKITSYNFQISEGTFSDNTPSTDQIFWSGVKVVYNGTEYEIADGACQSVDVHIYWQLSNPNSFSASTTLPSLTNDDFIVAYNNSGTATLVWNSTLVNGNRIATGSITALNIASATITANEIATGAITADKILAGTITANKLTTYNFIVSEGTFTNDSPSAGYVSWSGMKVVYNGVEREINDGNTDKKHIYWQLSSPSIFSSSDTLPALGNDDFLVSFNNSGTNTLVWNSTIINGNRITAGSITASNIAASSITANEISVSELSAISANMGSITAGTITGVTIQTATTGLRTVMDSNNLRFYSNSTQKALIRPDSTNSLVIGTIADVYITDLAGTPRFRFNDNGDFNISGSGTKITWGSGRYLDDSPGDGLAINGIFASNQDNNDSLGRSTKRWSNVYAGNCRCNNYYSGDGSKGGDYSSHRIITNIWQDGSVLWCSQRDYTFKDGLLTSRSSESDRRVN